jgi:LysR family hydrogen peroxide-inducible transcriptional activator
MITLRQLRYLSSLARHRHFGRAADDCAVTQPALSMQVKELEREIGAELVERRPGDIALTETGLEVARRAEHILAATRDLVEFVRHRDLLSGSLRLGIIPTLAPYILPRVLPQLQTEYPNLRLDVRETQTKNLLAELVSGDLDVILLALPADGAELETLRLFDDPFLLAVPATEAWPADGRVAMANVDQSRLILLEEGHCLRDQALAFCAAPRGLAPAGLGATSLATVMQMVANGYGMTLLPTVAADAEARDSRIRLLRFAEPEPARTVGLAWRRTSPRKKDFAALGEVLVRTVAPSADLIAGSIAPSAKHLRRERAGHRAPLA